MRQLSISDDLKVSDMIHQLRTESDMTMQYLAYKSGVSLSAISRYEKGDRLPGLEAFQKLINALGFEICLKRK